MFLVIRRLAAIFLIPIFLIVMTLGLVVFRLNSTVLEPEFYAETLVEVDFYNFLYDTALPQALDDSGVDLQQGIVGLNLTNEHVTTYAKTVFPPEFLEATVIEVTSELIPYLTGETDAFAIQIPLNGRVGAALGVVRTAVDESDVYGYVFDELVAPEVGPDSRYLASLPYGLTLSGDEIIAGLQEVAPRDWLEGQIDAALTEIEPYVTGDAESFAIVIPLQERVSIALDVFSRWLQGSIATGGAYDYLLEEQIVPVVTENLGGAAVLPFGVKITDTELIEALGEVLPPSWVSERVGDAIDALGPYITGQTDELRLVIPLGDRWAVASEQLVGLADAKFEALYDALPDCTLEQLLDFSPSLTEFPACKAPIVTYDDLKALVGLDVLTELTGSIVGLLPQDIVVTEAELLGLVADAVDLDQIRGYLRDGYAYTDVDLRADVADLAGASYLDRYDEVLGWLRDGVVFTEQDVRDEIEPSDFELFDNVRGWIGLGRSLLFLLFLVPALIAAAIGVLGGRNWGSRLAWAGVAPLLAGLLVASSLGVGIGPAGDALKDVIRSFSGEPILIEKTVDVGQALVDAFSGPIRTQGTILAAIGLAMVAGGIVGSSRSGTARLAPASGPGPVAPPPAEPEPSEPTPTEDAAEAPVGDEPQERPPSG